jgi:hypothetical protein
MIWCLPQVCLSLINQFIGPSDDLKNYFLKNVVPKLKGKKVAKLTFRSKITGKITYGPCIMCYRQGDGKTVGCNLHPILFKDNILIVTDYYLKISLLFYFRRNVLKEFRKKWKLIGTRSNGSFTIPCLICYIRGNGINRGCGSKLCDNSMSVMMSETQFRMLMHKYKHREKYHI